MSLKSLTSPDSLAPTSPFSNYSNLSTSSISNNNSPSLITQATYKKPTSKHVTQLSTSSAAGIAVANQVTPEKLAHLLLITGPLAIRHITSNLSRQINGFEKLSLSKQRRLIMSCLNQGFEEESIIFEKIGWGQWRAKKVDREDFIKERNAIRISNAKVKDGDHGTAPPPSTSSNISSAAANARRESITRNKYETDHHEKFLKSDSSHSQGNSSSKNDYAIASDDEDEEEEDEDVISSDFYDEEEEDEEHLFKFDDEDQIPPLKLNSRVVSPPLGSTSSAGGIRRSSMTRGIQKPKFKTHRSNSQTPTSPDLRHYTTKTKVEPIPNTSTAVNRRHSSIRSTLSNENGEDLSDTDEEDWQSIGALKLRKNDVPDIKISTPNMLKDEQDAVYALVNLRSI